LTTHTLNEVDLVQNSALGATLMWRFSSAYQEARAVPTPLPLLFIVLPICLHAHTVAVVNATRKSSGLTLFAAKLGEARDQLLAVHARALSMRQLSFDSLGMGIRSRLMKLDYQTAAVRSNDAKLPSMPERIKPNLDAAAKFGYWCSSLELGQVANVLKLEF
jgi:hypothetical protein